MKSKHSNKKQVLSSHSTTLTWNNLSAKVGDKNIISNCTGFCTPGQMLAIMGSSGAGKTTLLSLLAAKINPLITVEGKVEANRQTFTHKQFHNFGGFIYQNDILHQTLTVRETLLFTANMKFKDGVRAEKRVEELINNFQLQKCANTYVGGMFLKGISGGQKKRVCIAVEMVGRPSLLILDEPTSGLDSYIAGRVIKVLKKLAEDGSTIVFTIHQPSYLLYSMLSRLIILDKGYTLYQGDANKVYQYILGLKLHIPQKTTISDFFMFEISSYKAKKYNYVTPFNYNSYKQIKQATIQQQYQKVFENAQDYYPKALSVLPFLSQFLILFQRQVKMLSRNKSKIRTSILNIIISLLFWGMIFFRAVSENRRPQQTLSYSQIVIEFIWIQNACFFGCSFLLFNGSNSTVLVFSQEKEIYTKQNDSKKYDSVPYFISKLLIELMRLSIMSILFGMGSYWLIGFEYNPLKFFIFCLILLSLSTVGNSIGMLLGTFFKFPKRAIAFSIIFMQILQLFGGLYNKLGSIPKWISWVQYISPFKYGLHSILLNQFGDYVYKTKGGSIYSYKIDLQINQTLWQCIGIVFGMSAMYYTLAFIFLKLFSKGIVA